VLKSAIWRTPYPSVIWFLVILVGSLMPATSVSDFSLFDKGVHFIFYAIFSFLLFLASLSYPNTQGSKLNRWFVVLVLGTSIGVCIELIQHIFISSRFGDLMDVVANTGGLIVALFIAELLNGNGAL